MFLLQSVLRFRFSSLDIICFSNRHLYFVWVRYDMFDICVLALFGTGIFVPVAVVGVVGCWYVKVSAHSERKGVYICVLVKRQSWVSRFWSEEATASREV